MPEPQPVTPPKRTPPVVCRRTPGVVVPIPTLPAVSIVTRWARVAPLRVQSCKLPDALVAAEPVSCEVIAADALLAELAPVVPKATSPTKSPSVVVLQIG